MLHFPGWKIGMILAVCVIAFWLALPNFVGLGHKEDIPSWLSQKTLNLGLDLRGGSYLLLEVDFDTYREEQLTQLVDDVRGRLREKRIGYQNLRTDGQSVTLDLRDASAADEVEDMLQAISRDLSVDVTDDTTIHITYTDDAIEQMQKNLVAQSIEIIRRRVDETGTKEPIIQRQGDVRIILQVPGLEDPEHLKNLLGRTAKMSFHLMNELEPFPSRPVRPKPGEMLLKGRDDDAPRYYMVKRKVILSGDMLVDARGSFGEGMRPEVNFRFNSLGGKKFAQITRENVEKPFAIVLDNEVISAPEIQGPILGGSGRITGNFTAQSANDLALLLRAGALPAPLTIVEERTVGPSLGSDSIAAGKTAIIIGIVLVMVVMLLLFGLFGLFSDIALVLNMLLIVGALSLFEATLTLPGIAGIVLTMGMAVDANVLIFERIREEVALGKTPYVSVDHGFRQAFKTIIDSNFTTLIATIILYIYGSGPVKGFAVTLSVGILASMFSAILFTRMLIVLWLKKTKPATLPL